VSKIKICGLRRVEDIQAVNQALPDFVGFVFAESSRRITADTAVRLKEKLDPRIKAVGVFVNENADVVEGFVRGGIIDWVQLHGDEDGAYIRLLQASCRCPVIRAVRIGETLPTLPEEADYLLFDTLSARRGGTGKPFDWNLLREYQGPPYFLAGGLTADNAANAIRLLRPFCVDVSSGAETDGAKDAGKIQAIVRAVRDVV
jgi:phosphoribosylanthranilate isomerase